MTEADWLDSGEPLKMLAYLDGTASDRKLRLLACACCRALIWTLLRNDESREVIQRAEQFADGLLGEEALRLAEQAALAAPPRLARDSKYWLPRQLAVAVAATNVTPASLARYVVNEVCELGDRRLHPGERRCKFTKNRLRVASVVRDLFGNPFTPAVIDPAWRTTAATSLAEAAYADRAFDRLPILADALEEAGCTDGAVIDHCRQPGEHARGCWVVDLVLGKQ